MVFAVFQIIFYGQIGQPRICVGTDHRDIRVLKLQQAHDGVNVIAADKAVINAQFVAVLIQMHGASHGKADGRPQLQIGKRILVAKPAQPAANAIVPDCQ